MNLKKYAEEMYKKGYYYLAETGEYISPKEYEERKKRKEKKICIPELTITTYACQMNSKIQKTKQKD